MHIVAGLALACATAGAGAAQEVAAGTRVRISAPTYVNGRAIDATGIRRTGSVVGMDSASITIRTERDGTEVTLPFSVIRNLEVSRGTSPAAGGSRGSVTRGALLGGGVGLAGGLFVMQVVNTSREEEGLEEDFSCDVDPESCGDRMSLGHVAAITVASTGVGALLGRVFRARGGEVWEEVPVRSIQLRARGSGVAAGVSLRF
jgi:hypothetical protein